MVGDSLTSDIRGARNVGLRSCWYNPQYLPPRPDIPADYTIGALPELPPLLERLFFHLRFLGQASFHVPGPGREALAALPALLFRFIGGKGPDQVLFALAPPVVIPRQDPVGRVQVIRQAQLRVLCLPQPFFTSSSVLEVQTLL